MFLTVLNVIMSMSWGGSLHREDRNRVGIQLRQIAEEFVDLWGAPNISDLFPMLARFDLQGVESKMKKLSSWFDRRYRGTLRHGKVHWSSNLRDSKEMMMEKVSTKETISIFFHLV
ncbi:hypothetical protein JRO89_XS11G0159700 [Xanthoceras sorbifolium]|uniref:Uncharacterized protein n=1 Tax=Xanthoceras sorbifolium TaxID=99658 RepID=A0ABQ8HFR0_9ROSI|nr:hypothetical protein JRO89_XS11G0159700 [Xanthoceras sorbifolium]